MFKPMQITAFMKSRVLCDQFFPLDGVLYAYAMREEYGAEVLSLPGEKSPNKPVNLPIEKRERAGHWYYACSFVEWPNVVVEYIDHWNKRFKYENQHLIDFHGKRGKIIIEEGRFKAYHMPVFTKYAQYLRWYCVGDVDWVRHILRFVNYIGKKTSQGEGAVFDWQVEQISSDFSERKDGKLMRALPSDNGVLYGIRPSYWLPENQTICELPNFGGE